ncbi:hypothetical protein [Bradyrhizobium sp. SHOUNA76]|uniref:hypothetical protein n=1 Tax=Bradyrhizobium sp. SHOUNA76 TaxID=2908927 RepID=UPI001FF5A0C8|nr:hypothetical protein [Bradyrhizobium sp. SHOUNA76]MCJ9702804.1 hypothetical protein [Bradyrhizobium sp. SHOUNA76]
MAILIDINTSPCPERTVPNLRKPGNRCLAQTFLTALVNRMVSKRGLQGPASRGNKGNVRNKVNDLKTTLRGKDAAVPLRALTGA